MTTLLDQIANAHLELAQKKHTPTAAMRTTAKRGLRLAGQKYNDMDPVAMSVGRRISSGQTLTNDHVEHMAAFHAAHDGTCPIGTDSGSAEDMLWGGAPGAQWSSARVAAMDVSSLSEHDAPTVLALDEDGKGVSLEVFIRDGMGEATQLDEEKGLIWAPILRSGMLATRPGPNGEKKHEPLVFVPGYSSDSRKEIGLQNLYDSYKAGAIQHVTIPTTHENGVLDNTGFIQDLKIVDSKKRPGEKVLVAAHDFRDPDVRKKVALGTIANRSCGIVYDYVNTETGDKFKQCIDHVALTNKPWVTGMTPYGEINDENDFESRGIVPLVLSEHPTEPSDDVSDQSWDATKDRFTDQQWAHSCVLDSGEGDPKIRFSEPIREPDGTINAVAVQKASSHLHRVKDASLSQKKAAARSLIAAHRRIGSQPPDHLRELVGASTALSERDRASLLLADVVWGSNELSMNDITSQVVGYLDEMTPQEEMYPIFSVLDVVGNPDPKALVRVHYGDPDSSQDAWVIPLEVDGDKVHLADFSEWTPVQQEWVTDEDADQDKKEVGDLLPEDLSLSERMNLGVSQAKRDRAKKAGNALSDGSYPIENKDDLNSAAVLAASGHGNVSAAKALIRRRAKELGVDVSTLPGFGNKKSKKSNMSVTPLKGGAVKPTTIEVIERLGLSEEQRAVLDPVLAEVETLKVNLAAERKAKREESVKTRVKELQGASFPPGFCRIYEEIALGDDGEVAAVLNLSDEKGHQTGEQEYTATEIAERLIAALPVDESGKVAFANLADLTTSPISGRPPLDPEDQAKVQGERKGPLSADEWLAQAEKDAPGVTAALNLSNSKEG